MELTLRRKDTKEPVAHLRVAGERRARQVFDKYADSELEIVEGHLEFAPKPVTLDPARAQRDRLLRRFAWTVEAHSPLTKANQAEWMQYLKALHKITVGVESSDQVIWPEAPAGFEYGD